MMENPCKHRTDRTPGCHDACHKYKEWREQYDKEKERIRLEKQKEDFGRPLGIKKPRRRW